MKEQDIVAGAERMALCLLKAEGFAYNGKTPIRDSTNPRAMRAWNIVENMLDAFNGTNLQNAVDNVGNGDTSNDPPVNATRPRVLISVSGGVAEALYHPEEVEVEIFDFDNFEDDPEGTKPVPAHFADLAKDTGIPVASGV